MKIIFTDLDGTLLQRGEKQINKNIKKSIYKVLESGNIFAVSSGRTYIELKYFFKDFQDDIYFICNDGSLAIYKEDTIFSKPMDKTMFSDFKSFTAHAKYVTYIKSADTMTVRNTVKQYRNHVVKIDSISDIDEEIYKISDFDKTVPCPLPVVYKNNIMNEFVADGCDKKDAVSYIINTLKIPKENSYAFGDNVNDLGMFKVCGKSYASAIAKPAIKKAADKTAHNIENEFLNIIGG